MIRVLNTIEQTIVDIDPEKVTLPKTLDVSFGSISIDPSKANIQYRLGLNLFDTNNIHLGKFPILRSNKEYSKGDYQRVKESLEQGQYDVFYNHRGKLYVIFTGDFADLNSLDRSQLNMGRKFTDTLDALADDFPEFVKKHRENIKPYHVP